MPTPSSCRGSVALAGANLALPPPLCPFPALPTRPLAQVALEGYVKPDAHGMAVELWLGEVEKVMMRTVRTYISASNEALLTASGPREIWMLQWPGQVRLHWPTPFPASLARVATTPSLL